MRFPSITRYTQLARQPLPKRYYTMSIPEFVAAAEKADPALKGSNEKDQQAIQKLSTEVEGLAKDTTVSTSLKARIPRARGWSICFSVIGEAKACADCPVSQLSVDPSDIPPFESAFVG